jgi:hypothetical protein
MIPRSKDEADEIKKIINAFKVNMLPECWKQLLT